MLCIRFLCWVKQHTLTNIYLFVTINVVNHGIKFSFIIDSSVLPWTLKFINICNLFWGIMNIKVPCNNNWRICISFLHFSNASNNFSINYFFILFLSSIYVHKDNSLHFIIFPFAKNNHGIHLVLKASII